MAHADDIIDLIGDIYDAALDPSLWPDVVGRAGRFVGGQVASIFSKSPIAAGGDVLCQSGIDPHFCRLYFEKYVKLDPATTGQYFAEVGQPIAVSDLMPQDELRETRFYQEWAAPQGMVDFISTVIDKSATSAALFGVFRYESDGLADDAARMRMQLIAPHIRRAVLIGRLIDLRSAEAAAFAEALERMACGIGLVDRLGRLVHANAAGRQLLEAGEPLFTRDGRLAARDGRTDQVLQDLIARSGAGDAAVDNGGTAILMTAQDGSHHVARVLPLTSRGRRATRQMSDPSAAIFMRRTVLDPAQSPELIAKAYRLTPTELRVLLGIVEVGGVPEVAGLLGVAETTIKTHLRRVFTKTGAARQADLVRIVAGFASPVAG
ncbi:LuxR C-terminal-related transcriptional regulator [Bradyrhizobium ontarionense]|uniref:LuxR C-terminal-related transcriptional regulator n=1 Tax=Bradyrhizobium ontarionense TaxID=2898149 RepID=A0ABY3RE27_9BRAD|nr:helix-turn-helix transcriptional regulator [Bradyrhizobium sp. A19]UFZ05232.1 LuxR C-terminal-related transcriptional regulator [Bradyrhizobium sp. A19]